MPTSFEGMSCADSLIWREVRQLLSKMQPQAAEQGSLDPLSARSVACNGEEPPFAGYAFQLADAAILECNAGARDEIFDRARDGSSASAELPMVNSNPTEYTQTCSWFIQ